MRVETRIELAVLLVAAVVVGGWVGLRMVRNGNDGEEVAQAPEAGNRVMQAPPMPDVEVRVQDPAVEKDVGTKQLVAIEEPEPEEVEKPQPPKKDPPPVAGGDLAAALDLVKAGKHFEARARLTALLLRTEGQQRAQIKNYLDGINRRLFFSRAPSPDADIYTMQPGEVLGDIVKRYDKPFYFTHLLERINGIADPRRIQVNQRIKIPKGDFSALVDKSAHRMTLFLNGHYVKEYPISVGALDTPTPAGKFTVANDKNVNPRWTSPDDGRTYKHGDPRNILGTRWIGFVDTLEFNGLGIHGTADESTIGKDISKGCVRMRNADVEEVFGMLMPGNTVTIVE